jgi:hypothetical protein
MTDHVSDRGAALPVLPPHDHLHIKQIRAPQGTSRETLVCQIDLICAPQLMSAEGPLRAPNGGSARGYFTDFASLAAR